MAQQQHKQERTDAPDPHEAHPGPDFEKGPAAPEFTNYVHPTAAGTRSAVPGAGVVRSDADAGPMDNDPDRQSRPFPGHGTGPLNAPGATRPGTTHSGVSSVPDPAGADSTGISTEEVTGGGDAPLSVPTDTVGPQPGGTGLREVADPNYTAASPLNQSIQAPPDSDPDQMAAEVEREREQNGR